MTVTIIQPQNSDGKSTPLCVFDTQSPRSGHDFEAFTPAMTFHKGIAEERPFVACRRCGAVLLVQR